MALDKAQLFVDESTPSIQGQGLELLANEFIVVTQINNRLSRRYDEMFLTQLNFMSTVNETILQDQGLFTDWIKRLEDQLNREKSSAQFTIDLAYNNAEEFTLTVNKKFNGITKSFVIKPDFFSSQDYQQIVKFSEHTADMFSKKSFIQIGERKHSISNFQQAFEWMMKEVKKGQHIQRYKGLGEMNPEQLWETTLDSNSRRMLQVTIEDVVAADEVFTTLMGDVVEPRRDFIVKNALDVANLDV
jgi:DNA gyrase subunit B